MLIKHNDIKIGLDGNPLSGQEKLSPSSKKIVEINFKSIIKIDVNIMNSIFKQLFQYGFHDTEISSIEGKGLKIGGDYNKKSNSVQ